MAENNPFRFLTSIQESKEYLMNTDQDEKEYNSFLIARGLSYHIDCVLFINEISKYPDIPNKFHYDYLFHSIRKMKRKYSKWPKKIKDEELQMIMEFYKVNRKRAEEYQMLLTEDAIKEIEASMEIGGI